MGAFLIKCQPYNSHQALKSRQDQLVAAREEAEAQLEQRRAELPTSKEIKGYVADFRALFQDGTFPERKALIRNFVQGIEKVIVVAVPWERRSVLEPQLGRQRKPYPRFSQRAVTAASRRGRPVVR